MGTRSRTALSCARAFADSASAARWARLGPLLVGGAGVSLTATGGAALFIRDTETVGEWFFNSLGKLKGI